MCYTIARLHIFKFNQSYVENADDAILVDYDGGTDFRFRNDGSGDLAISASLEDYNYLDCQIRADQ